MSAITEILATVCNVWVYAPYNHCSMYTLSIAINFIDPTILMVRGNGPIHHVQSSVNYQFTYNVMYDVKLVLRC